MQKRWMILTLIVGVMISACSQPEALPTLFIADTDIPPTESPTDTPAPTDLPTSVPLDLQPTWTDTPDTSDVTDTLTPSITPKPFTETPLPVPKVVSPSCDNFSVDFDLSSYEFPIDEPPVVAWVPVDGAVLYRLFLYDENLNTVQDDIVTDQTSWTFDPQLFLLDFTYIWTVWPLDEIGDQMCFERGAELIPIRP